MSGLGAWENLSLRRRKAPVKGALTAVRRAARTPHPGAVLPAPRKQPAPRPWLWVRGRGALTRGPLEGLRRTAGALGAGAVLARPDLGVQGPDVEEHAALLEGQGPLLGRDPRERVIPARLGQAGWGSATTGGGRRAGCKPGRPQGTPPNPRRRPTSGRAAPGSGRG